VVVLPSGSCFLDGFGTVSLARSGQLGACPTALVPLEQERRDEPACEHFSRFIACRNLLRLLPWL